MATTLHHWKDGSTFEGSGGRFSDVTNPATGEVSAQLSLASEADVESVVASARDAFPGWRDTSLAKRTQILFAFRELLNARKGELAAILTAEHGKVLSDALGEVSRGQEVVEFACGIPHLVRARSPRTPRPRWTCTRFGSRSASWEESPRSTSRRWCRCDSFPLPSPRATQSC